MKPNYRINTRVSLIILLVLLAGCSLYPNIKTSESKELNGGTLLYSIDSENTRKIIRLGVEESDSIKVYGLNVYKIPYTTKDSKNRTIRVSGLLSVPIKARGSIGLVSYSHGTITLNAKAPTEKNIRKRHPDIISLSFSAIGGFATAQADYIGYGDSANHYHPYMLKKELANASVDFIKAVKKFAKNNHIKLNKQLYVAGYSEGGYVAMATVDKLEREGVKVTAAAPMAGAYDLNYMARAVLGLENESLKTYAMTYTILTLNAYAKRYNIDISTIIKEPYASKIDKLLDGKHTFSQIHDALPRSEIGKNGLLRKDFFNSYKNNPNNWFRKTLTENSLHNSNPKTLMKLIHCKGDDQVPYTISKRTLNAMKQRGKHNISLVTPDLLEKNSEKWGHIKCFMPSLEYVTNWFIEVRDNQE